MLHLALVVRSPSGNDDEDKVVTRSVRWRNEATSLHTERGVQELTEAFRTLVSDERLAGAKVRIALGGEFCVTRVITGPTEDVRREFAELEERSLRYLTLGPGRKALAGNIQQLDARHQYALLAVANQRTLDLLMRIADDGESANRIDRAVADRAEPGPGSLAGGLPGGLPDHSARRRCRRAGHLPPRPAAAWTTGPAATRTPTTWPTSSRSICRGCSVTWSVITATSTRR